MVHTITIGVKGKKGTRTISVNSDDNSIKLSTMKVFAHASAVFGAMPKNEARRLRKILASHGLSSVAAISRSNDAGVALKMKVVAAQLPLKVAA